MSDEQPQPEWIFPEEKTSNKGRIWLIVGLSVLALLIVGALLFLLLPRGGSSTPSPTPTDSTSTTPSPAPTSTTTRTPTPTSVPTHTPTSEPVPTQPPVSEPDMGEFVEQVRSRLDDGIRGLQLIQDNMDLGAQIVDSLQNDAAVLSDTPAPNTISADWNNAVVDYAAKLSALRSTYDNDSDPQAPLDAAGAALQKLRAVAGL